MTIDIEELKRLAEAATPGPWFRSGDHAMKDLGKYSTHIADCMGNDGDAAFVAAANPASVLELIDRIAALEAEIADQRNIAFAAQKEAARLADLEKELRRDAERYRWLRDQRIRTIKTSIVVRDNQSHLAYDKLDSMIDAARATSPETSPPSQGQ